MQRHLAQHIGKVGAGTQTLAGAHRIRGLTIGAMREQDARFLECLAQRSHIQCHGGIHRDVGLAHVAVQGVRRLVEVALQAGAAAAYRVDFASEIEDAWFAGVETVGVSSGASVPEELVDEVLASLATRGYGDVELVQTAEEDVQFSLPAELRKTMKAAGEETTNKIKRH